MSWAPYAIQAVGLLASYSSAKSAGEQSERNGAIARLRGLREAEQIRKDGKKHIGAQHLAIAKSGFRSTGSVMEVLYETAGDVERNAQNVLMASTQTADSYLAQGVQQKSLARINLLKTGFETYNKFKN